MYVSLDRSWSTDRVNGTRRTRVNDHMSYPQPRIDRITRIKEQRKGRKRGEQRKGPPGFIQGKCAYVDGDPRTNSIPPIPSHHSVALPSTTSSIVVIHARNEHRAEPVALHAHATRLVHCCYLPSTPSHHYTHYRAESDPNPYAESDPNHPQNQTLTIRRTRP